MTNERFEALQKLAILCQMSSVEALLNGQWDEIQKAKEFAGDALGEVLDELQELQSRLQLAEGQNEVLREQFREAVQDFERAQWGGDPERPRVLTIVYTRQAWGAIRALWGDPR